MWWCQDSCIRTLYKMGVIIRFRNLKDMPCILKLPEMVSHTKIQSGKEILKEMLFSTAGLLFYHCGGGQRGRPRSRWRITGRDEGHVECPLGWNYGHEEPGDNDSIWVHADRAGANMRLPLWGEIHGPEWPRQPGRCTMLHQHRFPPDQLLQGQWEAYLLIRVCRRCLLFTCSSQWGPRHCQWSSLDGRLQLLPATGILWLRY